ncbi:MAG TPA: hypothetical protein VFX17_04005 [Patescibacteria group bacterium]|nr:hypothetical protein [Patescibacteria group bacterium]
MKSKSGKRFRLKREKEAKAALETQIFRLSDIKPSWVDFSKFTKKFRGLRAKSIGL